MKRTFHFLLLLFCISTSASAQNYYDVSEFRDQLPELKQTDVVNFSKKDTNAFVTSCSLDTVSRILYYYHCYGGLFSYQPMSKPDMNAILAKKITPFEYFDLVTTFNVNLIEKAKKNLEDNGSNAKFTSLEKQYLDIADSVKFPSTLSKLLELDKQMVSLEVQDTRFHSVNPKYIKRDRSYYKTFNDLQGQMVIWRLSDSIATFYSKSDEPPVYKAVLDLKKAVICFYNRSDSLVDKIEINKSKIALLASKESDVFALYRMWLEWKRQSITQAIEETKKSGRVAENKQYALNVLSEQVKMLSAIDYKIEYFTNADKQFVLQKLRRQFGAIFAPNDPWETGRLVYHTRGDKRYELTDHRGNVMVVISDMKKGIPRKDDSTKVDHYEAIVLGATDYTPFGSAMEGRSFNSDKYPYGYNGKEDDNETGYENYGMRIYDPRVARFLSVDPLTKAYPELTPYQFASNTPIQAVDLDGQEAFFIHGTKSGPEVWSTKLTNLVRTTFTNNIHQDATFSWKEFSKSYLNDEKDRTVAAMRLVDHIMDYRKTNKITDEEITLIGHSHGGNVAIQAAGILYEKYGITVNIINFNTPAYNSGGTNRENPGNTSGINALRHFWTEQDGIAGGFAGDDKYTDNNLIKMFDGKNIELKNPLKKGWLTAHFLDNINLEELKQHANEKVPEVPAWQRNPEPAAKKAATTTP